MDSGLASGQFAAGGAVRAPVVAVVIPVFRHSVLLSEAIDSVLVQDFTQEIAIVLVNDGCPLAETHQVCAAFALRYAGKVFYIRRANGGLSAARNTGVRFALGRWASVEAVYLLDADNRLHPSALRQAHARMGGDKSVGWVYPNVDMFGIGGNLDYGGAYSLLAHTQDNICEAGSLISRRVFEAGAWFDETMRQGYEDWEFWLQAAARGFRGVHEPRLGLQYRKRAESMLSATSRAHAEITAYIRRKHPWLFQPKGLARLEARDAPRFVICAADTGEIFMTGDPARLGAAVAPGECERRFWQARAEPSKVHFPPFIVAASRRALETLARAGMLRWAFWALESGLDTAAVAALFLAGDGAMHAIAVEGDVAPEGTMAVACSDLLMIPASALVSDAPGGQADWIDALDGEPPPVTVAWTRLTMAGLPAGEGDGPGAGGLMRLNDMLRRSRYHEQGLLRWNWRDVYLKPRQGHYKLLRAELGRNAVAYPFQADGSGHAGFLLPIAEFGGVEKVTCSVARELRRNGWRVHLFLMGNDTIALPPEFEGVFETINILRDPGAAAWGGGGLFQGTRLPLWHNGADTSAALGLLFWLDVVINCHSPGANEVMGQLRRFGVMTVDYLHVIDRSPLQMPVGHPVLALAYEHAYDLIVTCSEALAHWMHAMGVPREKLLAVRNGPGFAMSEEQLAPLRAARDAFAPELHLLYMGRLDRQKGLRRLAAIVRGTRDSLPPVAWRIIGRSILKDDEAGIAAIEELLEPPVMETDEILARLGWAHVLVLPSHWEGMPLMVIEALHCGVVVVATDTGAMAEIIEDGVNGFLVPNDERAAAEMTRIILRVSRDRALLRRMALAAAQSAVNFSWEHSVAPLARRLEETRTRTTAV